MLMSIRARQMHVRLSIYALAWGIGAYAPAEASVLEIANDGTVTRYNFPTAVTPQSVAPILAGVVSIPQHRAPAPIAHLFIEAGHASNISPRLLEAVAWAESRFNERAVSPRGAQGVMQLMPGTAAELGVDPGNSDENIKGGARYLRQMLETFDGDVELALAAYNAGPTAVRRHNGVPPYPQTRAYVASVMEYLAACAQQEQ